MNDTSEIQTMADYGGQDATAKGHRADELRNITEPARNPPAPGATPTYRIKIDHAMELIVRDAKAAPSHLVPSLPPSEKPTIEPIFGRPKPLGAPASPPAGNGSTATPMAPTGAAPAGEPQPVPGAGGMPAAGSGAGSAAPAPAPAHPAPAPAPAHPAPARAGSAAPGGHAP
jgi:hypothetical protein